MRRLRNVIILLVITSTFTMSIGCSDESDSVLTILRCGDSVGPEPPEKLESEQDTLNCSGTAITVEGPVKLDLNGNTVSCDGSPGSLGIHVIGTSAEVINGSVTNCEIGVLVEGEGSHKIETMDASGNGAMMVEGGGVYLNSDNNILRKITVKDNLEVGMWVDGDQNDVNESNISENHFLGLVITGNENEIKDVNADENQNTNIVINNKFGGGDNNLIDGCTANGSLQNDGIYINGVNNQILDCEASNNFVDGIDNAIGGRDNIYRNNVALGNHTASDLGDEFNFEGVDLEDDVSECDGNTWEDNEFVTSRAQGVESPDCID